MFVYVDSTELFLVQKPQGLLFLCHGIPTSSWEAQKNQFLFHLNKFSSLALAEHTKILFFSAKERKVWEFFYFFIIFFTFYFWLRWVFVAARGLSVVAMSGGYSSLRCAGFSLWWLLLWRSTGSRHVGSVVVVRGLQSAGSVVVAHGLSCSAACGIFPDQGSNPCPLHWQADS